MVLPGSDRLTSRPGFAGALSDSDRVQLERINALRQSLMEPLLAFQKKVHGATPRQISTALFEAIKPTMRISICNSWRQDLRRTVRLRWQRSRGALGMC